MVRKSDKFNLIELIDLKIKSLESEQKNRGVNLWVAWGAMATLCWMFLVIAEKNDFSLINSLWWFVFFSILYDLFEDFKFLNTSQLQSEGEKPRFLQINPEIRLLLSASLFKSLTLLYLFFQSEKHSFETYWAIYFFLIFDLSNFLVVLALNFFDLPLLKNKGFLKVSPFIIFSRLVILFFVLLEIKDSGNIVVNFSDIRIGLLLTAVFLITSHLSKLPQEEWVLSNLRNLQTSIIVNEISLPNAEKKYAEYLKGSTLPEIFKKSQEELDKILSHYEKQIIETAKSSDKKFNNLQKITRLLKIESKKTSPSKKSIEKVSSLFKLDEKTLKTTQNELKTLKALSDKIFKKTDYQISLSKWLYIFEPETTAKYALLLIGKNKNKFNAFKRKHKKISEIIDLSQKEYRIIRDFLVSIETKLIERPQ